MYNADKLLLSLCVGILVFVMVNPYAVIRFPDFWRYFSGIVAGKSALSGHVIAAYANYLAGILPAAFGWPLFLCAVTGVVLLFFNAGASEAAAGGFVLLYILRFGAVRETMLFYCLPLLPFLLLAAVKAILSLGRHRLAAVALVLVGIYTVAYSFSYERLFIGVDTREAASRWIEENIPPSAVIGVSKSDFWTPPVLKEYRPRHNVLFGGSPQSPLSDAIIGLGGVALHADYLVLTSDEYYRYAGCYPGEFRKEKAVLDTIMHGDFTTVATFERHASLFGIPFYREYVALDWMFANPTIVVLKRK